MITTDPPNIDVLRSRYIDLLMKLASQREGDEQAALLDRVEQVLEVEEQKRVAKLSPLPREEENNEEDR